MCVCVWGGCECVYVCVRMGERECVCVGGEGVECMHSCVLVFLHERGGRSMREGECVCVPTYNARVQYNKRLFMA